jgi:hypothetical protein
LRAAAATQQQEEEKRRHDMARKHTSIICLPAGGLAEGCERG